MLARGVHPLAVSDDDGLGALVAEFFGWRLFDNVTVAIWVFGVVLVDYQVEVGALLALEKPVFDNFLNVEFEEDM